MTVLTELTYFIAVTGVAECIAQALEDNRVSGTLGRPERVLMAPGAEVPWDGGRDCAQLGLAITHGPYPSTRFPVEELEDAQGGCVVGPTAIRVTASLIRCTYHPPPTNDGKTPPTPQAQTNAARFQCIEEFFMRQAIICCLTEMKDHDLIDDFRIGSSDRQVNGDMGEVSVVFSLQVLGG